MNFIKKMNEALLGVLPVTAIVLVLNLFIRPMDETSFWAFVVGAALLIAGLILYGVGSGSSIGFMGEMIGSQVAKSKKKGVILGICGAIGVIVTVAEPDLSVLASQVDGVPNALLILSIALGVGLFTVVAVLRLIFKVSLKWVLIVFYAIVFALAVLLPREFVPLSFDASGVTTGPLTVPFIMALGASLSVAFAGKDSQDSSFGIVGICSIGPIIAVMLLSLFLSPDVAEEAAVGGFESVAEMFAAYGKNLPHFLKEMAISLAPILVFFLIYNFVSFRLSFKRIMKTLVGALYVYIGLSVFLLGANVGFVPAGRHIGMALAEKGGGYLIAVGAILGAVIVLAEPAVHVLTAQVEEITGGVISKRVMMPVMCASMAISVGLAMMRIVFDIDLIWILGAGYATALLLTFAVPKIFTGIAFDSGGVASGAMTAAFLLPMANGATYAIYGGSGNIGSYIMRDAFGVVALVAMTPLVAIQLIGFVYRLRTVKIRRAKTEEAAELLLSDGEVIVLSEYVPQSDSVPAVTKHSRMRR